MNEMLCDENSSWCKQLYSEYVYGSRSGEDYNTCSTEAACETSETTVMKCILLYKNVTRLLCQRLFVSFEICQLILFDESYLKEFVSRVQHHV